MANNRYEDYERSAGGGTPVLLMLLMVAIGCAFGVFYSIEDKLAAFAFLVVGGGALLGYTTGAWKMFSMLAGSLAAYFLAAPTAAKLVPLIESTLGEKISSPLMGLILSGIAAGCVATMLIMSIGLVLINRIDVLKWLDQSLGMVAGCIQSAGLVAVLLWGILALEPQIRQLRGSIAEDNQQVSGGIHQRLLDLASATRSSQLLAHLERWNPFLEVPQLRSILDQSGQIAQAVQGIGRGQDSLAESLVNDPQVRRIVNKLQSAEDIHSAAEVLHSNDVGGVIQKLVDGQYKNK